MRPVVSVVTPTYNRVALLKHTVESVMNQTVEGLEYIVVDDGSTDGTSAYLDTLPAHVKIIRLSNGGQVRALTTGWAQAEGQNLTYLSDDDLLAPDALAKLVAYLDSHPAAAAVFPNADLVDLDGNLIQNGVCRPFSLQALTVELQCYIGPGAVFRRDIYAATGGWDPACRLLPDLDFWTRVGLLGTIDFLPEVLAFYRVHPGSLSVPSNRSEAMAMEYNYVVEKFFDAPSCPHELRKWKNRALANACLILARNHLRNMDLNRLSKSLTTAYRRDPGSLNARAMAQLAGSIVPLSIKQTIRRLIRRSRRETTYKTSNANTDQTH